MNAVAFNNQRYAMPNIALNKRNTSARVDLFSQLSENAEPVRIYSEDELRQHRTISGYRLCRPLACIFFVILHNSS